MQPTSEKEKPEPGTYVRIPYNAQQSKMSYQPYNQVGYKSKNKFGYEKRAKQENYPKLPSWNESGTRYPYSSSKNYFKNNKGELKGEGLFSIFMSGLPNDTYKKDIYDKFSVVGRIEDLIM